MKLLKYRWITVFLVILFALPTWASIPSEINNVVWPPNNEAGTFYLSINEDRKTKLHPRKGYITALTPISVVKRNGKFAHAELSEKRAIVLLAL